NGSLNKKIPNINMSVGATYCINPVNDIGILRAPAENSIRGVAVTAPEKRSQNDELLTPTEALPSCHMYHKYIKPAGAVAIHSIVMLLIASIGTIFLINPYNPNEHASNNEMPGNTPIFTVIYSTPITARAIAIHSNLDRKSTRLNSS